ncbi:hypothetical protein TH63_15995 [Rufibacter radiotolerans]|uniref:Uncharacterized protein n=1 Tax=Rufibacter radiotolerans TaxID=1379910 RepID=A0A0H4VLU2_9BACT|nr:hypothetical protein TH63_15995 [Rufibacter radiotolerans]
MKIFGLFLFGPCLKRKKSRGWLAVRKNYCNLPSPKATLAVGKGQMFKGRVIFAPLKLTSL